jgi:cell division protein FtsL
MKANPQQLIHAYKNAPWRMQLQLIGMFSLTVVVIALIAGLYLNVTARAATVGREIQDMELDILELQHITADLENQLGLLTSIKTMERRADDLGFQSVNPAEILYVAVPGYAGRQSVSLAPPPGPVTASDFGIPSEYTQTLFEWIVKSTLDNVSTQPLNWLNEIGVGSAEAWEGGGTP